MLEAPSGLACFSLAYSFNLLFCYLLALYVYYRKMKEGKKMCAVCNERIVSLLEVALNRRRLN